MSKETEIKKCPCGGQVEVVSRNNCDFRIYCNSERDFKTPPYTSKGELITAWNTREESNCDTCTTNRDYKKALEEYTDLQSRLTATEKENKEHKRVRYENRKYFNKTCQEYINRIKELKGVADKLKEFARQVIHEYCWGHEMDGLEIQDLAENLGLLVPHIATEADVDEESDYEVGDSIFVFTKALKAK